MNGGGTTSVAKIVVLAWPDGPLRRQVASAPAGAAGTMGHVAAVSTPYEAAAEILIGPTAALVVDLPVLTAPHVRLLSLAADFGVPAFGVGALRPGLTCGDLHHLRQVRAEDLDGLLGAACREFENSMRWAEAAEEGPESALEAALAEPPPAVEAASSPLSQDTGTARLQPPAGQYVPVPPVGAASSPLPATQAFVAAPKAKESQAGMPELPGSQAGMPELPPAGAPPPPPGDVTNLLTREELSALLEEEP